MNIRTRKEQSGHAWASKRGKKRGGGHMHLRMWEKQSDMATG